MTVICTLTHLAPRKWTMLEELGRPAQQASGVRSVPRIRQSRRTNRGRFCFECDAADCSLDVYVTIIRINRVAVAAQMTGSRSALTLRWFLHDVLVDVWMPRSTSCPAGFSLYRRSAPMLP